MALTSRENAHSGFTNKAAPLTNDEIDQNWFDLYDLIESNTDGITAIHTQNTDQYLDQSGSNEVSASDLADLVYEADNNPLHVQGTDQGLDTGGANAVTASQLKSFLTKEATGNQVLAASGNTDGSKTILPDTSSTGITITFRSVDIIEERLYFVHDYQSNAAANNIVINTEGSETIDGGSEISIATNQGFAWITVVGGNLITLNKLLS
jgi:hypothetical protein